MNDGEIGDSTSLLSSQEFVSSRPTAPASRRAFLQSVAAGSAVVVTGAALPFVGYASSAGADESPTALIGEVVSSDSSSLLLQSSSGKVKVTPIPGARMYSGAFGEATSPIEFINGDRVVAQGLWRNKIFSAAAVGSVYKPFEMTVQSVSDNGSIAHTSAGEVLLGQGRLPYTSDSAQPPAPSVFPGEIVSGLEWQDPKTGDRYLMIAN
jgi:hypothetical protein